MDIKYLIGEELEEIKNSNHWDIINPNLIQTIQIKFNLSKLQAEQEIENWLELYKLI